LKEEAVSKPGEPVGQNGNTSDTVEVPKELNWQEVSAIAAALGVYVYIVGAAALLVPVARVYMDYDLATAWYAISLVPRNVIVGHATRVAVSKIGFLIIVSVAYLMVYLAIRNLNVLFRAASRAELAVEEAKAGVIENGSLALLSVAVRIAIVVSVLITALTILAVSAVLLGRVILREYGLSGNPYLLSLLVINALLLTVGPVLLWHHMIKTHLIQVSEAPHRRFLLPYVTNWPRILAIGLVYLIVAYTGVLAVAMLAPPSLPKAVVHTSLRRGEIEGRLVTHADGFWYVFVQQEGITLRAIPDAKVKHVEVKSRVD
jgi:hypothetical protein